ncbi:hypothetical protein DRN69_06020 [Candidatus Pacearchaeota archaeon]|nr:MAG: hypothetical protein DRN69_06020 [Candidatus Pacearchaeota archaeon]
MISTSICKKLTFLDIITFFANLYKQSIKINLMISTILWSFLFLLIIVIIGSSVYLMFQLANKEKDEKEELST